MGPRRPFVAERYQPNESQCFLLLLVNSFLETEDISHLPLPWTYHAERTGRSLLFLARHVGFPWKEACGHPGREHPVSIPRQEEAAEAWACLRESRKF